MMRHPKYGNFTAFPAAGGVLDQPAKTMAVLRTIQDVYVEKLIEEMNRH
jgi:hypothetical protein